VWSDFVNQTNKYGTIGREELVWQFSLEDIATNVVVFCATAGVSMLDLPV